MTSRRGTMIGLRTTTFPLASELPLLQLPMSDLLRAIVSLRLTGLGYKRIARERTSAAIGRAITRD